ncbi:hypothetical protein A2671_01885 [Candidatus Kaiserbacteria bacterium RIFCSPHIGHO2_01_FULL_49_13]|uniref:ABC transporter substrate-binding protein n=1 Tax=Candidatus Kaiserbacteria bacterium RIFCSPHIGHO2_01_FULL_49_13 TaxID=1798477 RepID=A0A1F6CE70_9BACT|nr:MAG: hypothetical protein A2671_01885 [Candidatus Kaiserbacteria bacterium RIFCSPHIGHO2_01_FULL_49_13]
MKTFNIVVLGVFIFLAVAGVLVFSGFGGFGRNSNQIGRVVVWGTLQSPIMESLFTSIRDERDDFSGVSYVEKDPRTYDRDLVEAIAAGKGPDLFLLEQDHILSLQDKVLRIPYANFSERAFKDSFIEEGELYLGAEGSIGLPFTVDPLVMYWNRDIFAATGIANPPKFWDEFLTLAPKLTKRTAANTIERSAAPLGEYSNNPSAKALLATLFMQAGTPIVAPTDDGVLHSVLDDRLNLPLPPAEAVLNFFTEFSNPSKAAYSWNRALPNARDMFTAGDLALYFGFASELPQIRNANVNLNFDVAQLPQVRDAKSAAVYGRMNALSIPKGALNVQGAANAALVLTSVDTLQKLGEVAVLPPVSRALLQTPPSESYKNVFYLSALIARAWFDPNAERTDAIFKTLVEDVTSGRARLSDAVANASRDLENLLQGR